VYSPALTKKPDPNRFGISLRTLNGDCLRYEDRTLNSGLCRRHTQLKLALIELINNLAHRRLIEVRRSSQRSRGLDGSGNWRDGRRHGDESRPSLHGAERHENTD
jgi:hypothetical protein